MPSTIPSTFSGSGVVSPSGVCEHEFGHKCHRVIPTRTRIEAWRIREVRTSSATKPRLLRCVCNDLLAKKHASMVYASTRPRDSFSHDQMPSLTVGRHFLEAPSETARPSRLQAPLVVGCKLRAIRLNAKMPPRSSAVLCRDRWCMPSYGFQLYP